MELSAGGDNTGWELKQLLGQCWAEAPVQAVTLYFAQAALPDHTQTVAQLGMADGALLSVEVSLPLDCSLVLCNGSSGRQLTLEHVMVWREEPVREARARLVAAELPRAVELLGVRQLREAVRSAGGSDRGVLEKPELVQRCVRLLRKQLLGRPMVLRTPGLLERLNNEVLLGATPINDRDTLVLGC